MDGFYRGVGAFVSFVGWTVGIALLNGFVLMMLWGWFVVPTFNVPSLPIVAAIGIGLIVRYLTFQMPKSDEKKEKETTKDKVEKYILRVAYPAVILLMGWVASLFM